MKEMVPDVTPLRQRMPPFQSHMESTSSTDESDVDLEEEKEEEGMDEEREREAEEYSSSGAWRKVQSVMLTVELSILNMESSSLLMKVT